MKILDGKKLADEIKQELKVEVSKMQDKPGLAAILVGNNQASQTYVNIKEKACGEVGINFFRHEFPENIPESELEDIVNSLNQDKNTHGILVQLPLPGNINTQSIINIIDPAKDADGFHPDNNKLLSLGKPRIISPPHAATLKLLEATGEKLNTFTAVILANSTEFAKPLQQLLSQHGVKSASLIKTDEFSTLTQKADIIISATGRPHSIQADDIKKDAILIDIGFTREDENIMGDIDPDSVSDKAAFLSPVPGGVGPLTVAYLLYNVVKLAKD